ncbi:MULTISPECIES: nitrogen fixation protein NifZ [unclassified Thiocapsa]|uniref:nitrogen fixation protein NifZ n=1 Tax=unclassified Thiocapsa TaxID=2641286 RepID=UPI0035B2999F
MDLSQLELGQLGPGDLVYAAADIYNDGGIPDLAEDALIAAAGTRGVILNIGHLEEDPERELYLVRFEGEGAELGPPAGCWPEELSTASHRAAAEAG